MATFTMANIVIGRSVVLAYVIPVAVYVPLSNPQDNEGVIRNKQAHHDRKNTPYIRMAKPLIPTFRMSLPSLPSSPSHESKSTSGSSSSSSTPTPASVVPAGGSTTVATSLRKLRTLTDFILQHAFIKISESKIVPKTMHTDKGFGISKNFGRDITYVMPSSYKFGDENDAKQIYQLRRKMFIITLMDMLGDATISIYIDIYKEKHRKFRIAIINGKLVFSDITKLKVKDFPLEKGEVPSVALKSLLYIVHPFV